MTMMRPRQRHRERSFACGPLDPPPDVFGVRAGLAEGHARWRHPMVLTGVLALVATVGVTGWAIGRQDPLAGAPARRGPVTPTTSYDSACGLAGGTTTTPGLAPNPDWQDFGITSLPVSAAYGPGRRSDTAAWSCFARTPMGAVLAAWTIPFRTDVAKDFAGVVRAQTVPGPGQDALLRQGQIPHPLTDRVEPLGFQILSYTPDAASISFHVTQYGRDFRCGAQVAWVGGSTGDWLLQLQPDGNVLSTCRPLGATETAGFVAWGPIATAAH